MKTSLLALTTAITFAACAPKLGISETQMIPAPPRDANCALEMQQVDPTSFTFNSTWDVLGYVTLFDKKAQDPMAAENRALVRPRACKRAERSSPWVSTRPIPPPCPSAEPAPV